MTDTVPFRGPRRTRVEMVDDEKWDAPSAKQLEELFGADSGRSSDFALYAKRFAALEMYKKLGSGERIKTETGLDIWKVARLCKRARKTNPVTGRPTGYWVCVPQHVRRQGTHARTSPFNPELTKVGLGYKGALKNFLSVHGDIADRLDYYLRTRKVSVDAIPEPRIYAARLVRVFHFFCKGKGLDNLTDQWPYCTSRVGENAIRAFYKRWKLKNPDIATANELGLDAAREQKVDKAVASNSTLVAEPFPLLYGRVEVDGHKLHAIGEVVFTNKFGLEVVVELRRMYALVMVCANIPLVLAARSCFGLRYDSNDVLGLVSDALFPPARRDKLLIDHPEYRYIEGADFPGNVIKDLRGNCWQELAWDADSAQISAAQKRQLEHLLKCKISVEHVGSPTARTFIERFNAFLARAFELLASGTGSHPRDPARNEPEAAAKKYRIRIELLDELLDLFVRNWNATYRPELDATPLQAAQQLVGQYRYHSNHLGELEPDPSRQRYSELYPSFRRELRMSRKRQGIGHGVLLVNLFGAKYSSKELVGNKLLLATTKRGCTVYVNPVDAREAWIVPDEYPELSIRVVVQNRALQRWKHPLHWRMQAVIWAAGKGRRERALTPDLMAAAAEGLGNQAASGDPQARAAFSTIIGEQARLEAGAVPRMEGDHGMEEPVLDEDEANDVEQDPEVVSVSATPVPATPAPAPTKAPARASAPKPSPKKQPNQQPTRSVPPVPVRPRAPLLRPPVPGDPFGFGGRT